VSTKSVMPRPARRRRPAPTAEVGAAARGRRLKALPIALVSAVLLWASFPPLDLWWLGWIAPVPWLLLVRARPKPRRLYTAGYAAGLVYWLASIQWMRLGHPTMYTAWIAFSVYLALWVPALLWLCRQAVHRLRVPLMVAAPITWVGLELLRAHCLSGFAWYFLGHTQYRWAALVQMSDLVGAYGVSFLMMLVAAVVALAIPGSWLARWGVFVPAEPPGPPRRLWPRLAVVGALLGLALGYGSVRLRQADFARGPTVALIQGNVPLELKRDPEATRRILDEYVRMTREAAERGPDLIIWPESMLRDWLVHVWPEVSDEQLGAFYPKEDEPAKLRENSELLPDFLARLSRAMHSALLIGVPAADVLPTGPRNYNSAVYVTPQQGIAGRYDKVHLVPFGEFLPLARTLPWLIALTPYPKGYGFAAGHGPVAIECAGHRFGVLICYEDTVPHLVREFTRGATAGSASEGRSASAAVDFLVNLTNDGWFRDSSELDQHLITSAFRAVECRTPLVRAANTGISAIIDGNGRIVPETVARDPRTGRTKEVKAVVVARVPLDNRRSLYVAWGDWFAGLCLWASAAVALWAIWDGLRGRRRRAPQQA
jgi:apolipoprotein N-acyltransferase